jgi:hypothetical protein
MNPDGRPEPVLRYIALGCLSTAIFVNAVSLLGWASGLLIIARIKPYYIPIAPSTALSFTILSASLLAHVLRPESSCRRRVAATGASLTFLICSLILTGYFFGTSSEIEHMGMTLPLRLERYPIGHMSPITATTLLMAATAALLLVLSSGGRQRLKSAAALLATAVISSGFIVSVGYLYGTPFLYGGTLIPVALPTAVAFLFTGLGLLAASGPRVLPVRVFAGTTVRSRLMRAFFPMIFVFALIYGLVYKTAFQGAGNPALAASLTALASVVVISTVVSRIAKSVGNEIDSANAERMKAEEAREKLILELSDALVRVKTLSGLLPICASCKKIRDDEGNWSQIEVYVSEHSSAEFSHGLCPSCAEKAYEDLGKLMKANRQE